MRVPVGFSTPSLAIMKANALALFACIVSAFVAGPARSADAISVSGHYEHRTDSESREMLGGLVCFFPDEQSAKLLPRPVETTKLTWFCFRNYKTAMKHLRIGQGGAPRQCGFQGEAQVRIDRYSAYLGEGDDFDTARLRSVLRASAPRPIPCP